MSWKIYLTIFFVFFILIAPVIILETDNDKAKKYCETNGWDGMNMRTDGYHCYYNIPHPSGTGIQRQYSGIIEVR